jgi:hypothetical protein
MVSTLDHGLLKIEPPELRQLLMAADGTWTLDEVAQAGHGIPPATWRPRLPPRPGVRCCRTRPVP